MMKKTLMTVGEVVMVTDNLHPYVVPYDEYVSF